MALFILNRVPRVNFLKTELFTFLMSPMMIPHCHNTRSIPFPMACKAPCLIPALTLLASHFASLNCTDLFCVLLFYFDPVEFARQLECCASQSPCLSALCKLGHFPIISWSERVSHTRLDKIMSPTPTGVVPCWSICF